MNRKSAIALCTTPFVIYAPAHAAHGAGNDRSHNRGAEFVVEAAAEFGGDDLATVFFTNGDDQTIKAGDGLSIHAGFKQRFNNDQSILKGTIGYKFHTTAADNSDVGTSSLPLNLSIMQKLDGNWHVSGGLTYQMNTELDGDGFFQDVKFDDSLGFSLGIGYSFFTLSYTNLDLGINDNEVDASNIGLRFGTAFF
jgi:hypothetical protein